MGFFNKIKDLFSKKKNKVEKAIVEKNAENVIVEQKKFDDGLKSASSNLNSIVNEIAKKYRKIDESLIEELEEYFISFDIGVQASKKIIDAIVEEAKLQNVKDGDLIRQIIIDKLFIYYIQDTDINSEITLKDGETNVILISGVNGVGKTTSIAKLANFFLKINKTVSVIAADTFRAGAVAQLEI
jgi:fused signal recognition particle receptor